MDNTPTERALSEMQIQQEQKPKEPKAGAGMAQGIKEGKPAWPGRLLHTINQRQQQYRL